jgi:hypothetical protein
VRFCGRSPELLYLHDKERFLQPGDGHQQVEALDLLVDL